jgi:hypothetical protein
VLYLGYEEVNKYQNEFFDLFWIFQRCWILAKLSERVRLSLGSANSFCVSMCMRTFGSDLILGWNNLWIEWVGKPSQRDFAICHNKNRNPPQPFFYSRFSLCLSPSLIWNFGSGRRKQAERASIVSLILVSVFVFDGELGESLAIERFRVGMV